MVGPNRLAKLISRGLRVTWREEPTQHDIEALDANIQRVGLVIRLRWLLVLALALFSGLTAVLYQRTVPVETLYENMRVPALALVFVLLYNTFYQLTYRRLGNIAILNHAQLLFDVLVVGLLVHYSGGVYSWFYAMFLLFVLEAPFILPHTRDVWLIAGFAVLVYAGVLVAESAGWVEHVDMPFVTNELAHNLEYVGMRILWVLTVLLGAATVGGYMMSVVRGRQRRLAETAVVDQATGLFNRAQFQQALRVEVGRARRTGAPMAVILIDVFGFAAFNEAFGFDAGNKMLRGLAEAFRRAVDEDPDGDPASDTVFRCGGEEFAVILSAGSARPSEPGPFGESVRRAAEALKTAAESVRMEGKSVRVSVGAATFPGDAATEEDLLTAADDALAAAARAGGELVEYAGMPSREAVGS